MTIKLSGDEVVKIIITLLKLAANISYNILANILQVSGYYWLSDEVLQKIKAKPEIAINLDKTNTNTSWLIVQAALANEPVKDVGTLYYKITNILQQDVGSDK